MASSILFECFCLVGPYQTKGFWPKSPPVQDSKVCILCTIPQYLHRCTISVIYTCPCFRYLVSRIWHVTSNIIFDLVPFELLYSDYPYKTSGIRIMVTWWFCGIMISAYKRIESKENQCKTHSCWKYAPIDGSEKIIRKS